jgi:hypothetical protein
MHVESRSEVQRPRHVNPRQPPLLMVRSKMNLTGGVRRSVAPHVWCACHQRKCISGLLQRCHRWTSAKARRAMGRSAAHAGADTRGDSWARVRKRHRWYVNYFSLFSNFWFPIFFILPNLNQIYIWFRVQVQNFIAQSKTRHDMQYWYYFIYLLFYLTIAF